MLFSCVSVTSCAQVPDLKSWNKAIKKQIQEGNVNQGLCTFIIMQEKGFYPDNFTFPLLADAAARRSLTRLGYSLHAQTIKTGYCSDLYVQTSLLNMYSSFKDVNYAYKVFNDMPVKDIIAWNSMLDAYTSNGQIEKATKMFKLMPLKDVTSSNIMISGYAKTGLLDLARTLFNSTPSIDTASWNSMILACTLAGNMEEARRFFIKVPKRNIVTWNTMLSGLLKTEQYGEVIELFDQMRAENIKPDHVTVSTVLSACAHLGSVESGRVLHIYALENYLMCPEVVTSLIDMYAKCGSIYHFLNVFYKSPVKDIFCWNAVISGLSLNSQGLEALKLFDELKFCKSLKPDDITFIGLLSGCSHSGLVQEGCSIFSSMKEFGISPKLEHYGCMVDLLGRANFLRQAYQLVESIMGLKPGERILGALLSASVVHRDIEVGRKVVGLMMDRGEEMKDGEFMMVSNLYATCGEWEEAARWREKMEEEGIVKNAGCSIVEIDGISHSFLAGDLV